MRKWSWVGLVWLVLGAVVPAGAQSRGGTEAEVRQGVLSRWSAWWTPGTGTEGRFWWEPEGGAAWLRVGEFQCGPLQEVRGSEGAVTWGPAVRQSGAWGAAWSGPLAGAWVLQKSDSLEAGVQVTGRFDEGTWGAGAGRNWDLDPGDGKPRWTDRGLVGGTWAGPNFKTGTEFRASREQGGGLQPVLAGRLSVGIGRWEVEGRGETTGGEPWTARVKGRWEEPGWRLEGTWDRSEGTGFLAAAEVRLWSWQWGAEGELLWDGQWSGRTKATVSGSAERGRWKLGWTVVPDPGQTVQKIEASWKEPGLEASVDWNVEGGRLGWFGPGSRLTWRLRWSF